MKKKLIMLFILSFFLLTFTIYALNHIYLIHIYVWNNEKGYGIKLSCEPREWGCIVIIALLLCINYCTG